MDQLFELIRSVSGIDVREVSFETRVQAKSVVADTIGVIIGGGARKTEVSSLVVNDRVGRLWWSPSEDGANILAGDRPRVAAATAAFVNATAGTFLELDEGYRPTGHPGVHVVPAALAVAQSLHASGTELLTGVLKGYEVTARLFEAYKLAYPLHPHGHLGGIGAAVAVASIAEVDPVETAAVASTLPVLSVWQPCFEGATVRNCYSGMAAATGVISAVLTRAGFSGSRQALDIAFGSLVGERALPDVLIEPVKPHDLRIHRNYFKLHSSCALTHAAVDAVLELLPLDPDVIDKIEVETIDNNLKVNRLAEPNDLSARFSMQYAVAAAILRGHTRPEAFDYDRSIAEFAQRVEVRASEELGSSWPASAPARVTIRTKKRSISRTVENARGHHSNPASEAELRGKFLNLVGGKQAQDLYDGLLSLDEIEDVHDLFDRLNIK